MIILLSLSCKSRIMSIEISTKIAAMCIKIWSVNPVLGSIILWLKRSSTLLKRSSTLLKRSIILLKNNLEFYLKVLVSHVLVLVVTKVEFVITTSYLTNLYQSLALFGAFIIEIFWNCGAKQSVSTCILFVSHRFKLLPVSTFLWKYNVRDEKSENLGISNSITFFFIKNSEI